MIEESDIPARERIREDLAARVNPELSRRFSSEAFQAHHDALMELGLHPELAPMAKAKISVVGSNGKGSVAWYLASLLEQAGRRTGLYTSPHLADFNERIRVNLEPAPFAELEKALNEAREIAEPGERRWTYFEIMTLMALRHFRDRQCDALVFEAGLGGRLDATRMLRPNLVVLTVIEAEHVNVLGDSPRDILREKLGIISPQTRVVCCMPQPHVSRETILKTARAFKPDVRVRFFQRENTGEDYLEFNRAFARFCLEGITNAQGPTPMGETVLPAPPGRMERRMLSAGDKSIPFLFDTAHNPPAFRTALTSLRNQGDFPGPKRCLLIYGMLPDRDPKGCVDVAEEAGFEHIMGIRAGFLRQTDGPGATPAEFPELIRARAAEIDLIIMLGSHRIYDIYNEISTMK